MTNIQTLIQELDHPSTRQTATSALIDLGSSAVDDLIQEMLAAENSGEKQEFAFILGKIGDPRAIQPLFATLRSEETGYQEVVALRRLQAVDALIKLLYHAADKKLRWRIVIEMSRMKDPRITQVLIQALHDSDEQVRANAIRGLHQSGSITTFADLEASLDDPAAIVFKAALWVALRVDRKRTLQWAAHRLRQGTSTQRALLLNELCYRVSHPDLIQPALLCLSDPDPETRKKAMRFLRWEEFPGILPPFLDALSSPDWEMRCVAVNTLGKFGEPEAVPALGQRLSDPNNRVRSCSAQALGKIKDPRALPDLEEALKREQDPQVRVDLLEALVDIGSDAALEVFFSNLAGSFKPSYFLPRKLAQSTPRRVLDIALTTFDAQDTSCQALLAQTLGEIGDPVAIPILAQASQSMDRGVADRAAEALAHFASLEAMQGVRQFIINTPDAWTKRNILITAAAWQDDSLLPEMLLALQAEDPYVHGGAAEALSRLGAPQAIEPLIALLQDPSKKRRFWAAAALGRLRAQSAVPALIQVLDLDRPPDVQTKDHVIWALGELRARQAVPVLLRALHMAINLDHLSLIRSACEALGKIGDPRAVDELLRVLTLSEFPLAQRWTAWALGKIGDPRAVEPLTRLLDEPQDNLRLAAIRALGQIGRPVEAQVLRPVLENEADPGWLLTLKALAYSRRVDPSLAGLLTNLLHHPSVPIQKLAGRALAKTGAAALPLLRDLLQDPDPVLRRYTTWILGEIGGDAAAKELISASTDLDGRVRYKAAQALTKISSAAARQALEKLLADPLPQVRVPAAAGLKLEK